MIFHIVAMNKDKVIGKDNKLPWHIPEDLKRFKRLTVPDAVVMGRKTFESIGKPLKARLNIILSRDPEYEVEGAHVFNNIEDAIDFAVSKESHTFIIGGEEIYSQTRHLINGIFLTEVDIEVDIDGDM